MERTIRFALATLILCLAAPLVEAGSTAAASLQFEPEAVARLAKKVEHELASRRAQVALISRVGRAPEDLPPGVEFTHVAYAVYSRISTNDGRVLRGYAIHNLYQNDDRGSADTSRLQQDYPLDYFGAAFALRSGVIVPRPELQRRLLEMIFSDGYAALHNPRYSAISNPFDTQYQNCTEFVLDVLNGALYRTTDSRKVKANIVAYFETEPLAVSPLKLWLGSLFVPDIKLSDHTGPVRTTTFGSIARFMQRYGLAEEVFTVSVDGERLASAPPAIAAAVR